MIFIADGNKHVLLGKDDTCPICEASRNEMGFSWNIAHGEATSSCCGSIYQLKGYYAKDASDEKKELLKMLDGEYIECTIKEEWIEPIKKAMKEKNASNINDDGVLKLAEHYLLKQE